jgi:hypothetical protein
MVRFFNPHPRRHLLGAPRPDLFPIGSRCGQQGVGQSATRDLFGNVPGPTPRSVHRAVASNPKLISYLAAGSVMGLSPFRYERRVMRNRVLALTLLLSLVIWGLATSIRH